MNRAFDIAKEAGAKQVQLSPVDTGWVAVIVSLKNVQSGFGDTAEEAVVAALEKS